MLRYVQIHILRSCILIPLGDFSSLRYIYTFGTTCLIGRLSRVANELESEMSAKLGGIEKA